MNQFSNKQYPRIGLGIIILKGKKVLLGLRKGPRGSGFYGLPGGFLENNESFEDGAKREVREETGLDGLSLRPIYLTGGISDNIHYADVIFYADYREGEPLVKETDRAEKWEWFSIFKLPSPLYGPTEIVLNRFASNYRFHKINLFLQNWFPGNKVSILYLDSVNSKNTNHSNVE
jgi:8-oxo-dGTP diphosphatase